jgi:uncharacterized membrane protein YeaQ/YmgE (transglycosylase-associated protein family)
MTLLVMLAVGAVAGWLAGLIVTGYGFGLLGNIVVGVVGAVIGSWVLPYFGVYSPGPNDILGKIITAVIGAVILLVLLGLVATAT